MTTETTPPVVAAPMAVREYARRRRQLGLMRPVSQEGIRKAIAQGRIRAVVYVPGKRSELEPKITDPEAADRELEATSAINQESRQDAAAEAMAADPAARVLPTGPVPGASDPLPQQAAPAENTAEHEARARQLEQERIEYARLRRQIAEADQRKRNAEAQLSEVAALRSMGQLVDASGVAQDMAQLGRLLKDRLEVLATIIGRQVAFTFSIEEGRAIDVCRGASSNFLRDLANETAAKLETKNAQGIAA